MSLVNDYFPSTLKPRHLAFGLVGNSGNSTTLTSVTTTNKAYTDFQALGSNSSHTDFKESGYIYITFIAGETTLTETFLVFDSEYQDASTGEITEYVIVLDTETSAIPTSAVPGPRDYFPQETQPTYNNFTDQEGSEVHTSFKSIVDGQKGYVFDPMDNGAGHAGFKNSGWQYYLTGNTNYTTTIEEDIVIDDEVSTESPGQTTLVEFGLVNDSSIVGAETAPLTDYVVLSESASGEVFFPVSFNATLVLKVVSTINPNFTNVLGVKAAISPNFTLDLGVQANNLTVVTSASAPTNPIAGTLVINGSTIFSHPESLPATIPDSGCRPYFPCTGLISDLAMSDIKSFSLNLQDAGGNWDVASFVDLPTFGTEIDLYGLTGTVVNKGFDWQNTGGNYTNSGIFGLRAMNRELAFLTFGRPEYTKNLVDKYANYPKPEFYKTHKDAAYMIGAVAGAQIQWQIPDFPLPNFQLQGGQTALSALESLASDCGGTIRWAGGNIYKAMFPDEPLGIWWIPDCCLILSINKQCHLDLNSGYYNPGVHILPQLSQFNSTQQNLTTNSENLSIINNPLIAGSRYAGQVENRVTVSKKLTSSDPVIPVDLPLDTENVFIRIITKTATTGSYVITESEAVSGSNGGNWFAIGSTHSGYSYLQGQVKLQFTITPDLFPSGNSDVDNGNFSLQIGITRKQPPYVANTIGSTLLAAKNILKYRFVPTCTGSITTTFFGSIPMPGMQLVANFNNETLTGIIESVTFNGPNTLTVNFVQWSRFEFYQQLSQSGNF